MPAVPAVPAVPVPAGLLRGNFIVALALHKPQPGGGVSCDWTGDGDRGPLNSAQVLSTSIAAFAIAATWTHQELRDEVLAVADQRQPEPHEPHDQPRPVDH